MNFDKWFYKQDKLLQIILLIIPFVGWVAELLIRFSVMTRTMSALHVLVFILFLVLGWGWFLCLIDLIYLAIKGHLILA